MIDLGGHYPDYEYLDPSSRSYRMLYGGLSAAVVQLMKGQPSGLNWMGVLPITVPATPAMTVLGGHRKEAMSITANVLESMLYWQRRKLAQNPNREPMIFPRFAKLALQQVRLQLLNASNPGGCVRTYADMALTAQSYMRYGALELPDGSWCKGTLVMPLANPSGNTLDLAPGCKVYAMCALDASGNAVAAETPPRPPPPDQVTTAAPTATPEEEEAAALETRLRQEGAAYSLAVHMLAQALGMSPQATTADMAAEMKDIGFEDTTVVGDWVRACQYETTCFSVRMHQEIRLARLRKKTARAMGTAKVIAGGVAVATAVVLIWRR